MSRLADTRTFGAWITLAVLAWLVYGAYARITENSCTYYKWVDKVGGCDFLGRCGVKYIDGTTGTEFTPAPGEMVCTERIGYLSWYLRGERPK